MPIVSAKAMLTRASERGYCVGAFNVTHLAQLMGVVDAAERCRAPVILQTSLSPVGFYGIDTLAALYRALAGRSSVPMCLHLDHCDDLAVCRRAADAGYTNIMIDASQHDFDENIRQTREIVEYCHGKGGISVEGELGTVSGVEDQVVVAEDEAQLCDPDQSQEFVQRTGVDLFAPAIGTAHGVYASPNPKIDVDRFAKINDLVNRPRVVAPLVIHGGTGLKEELVRRLIEAGGAKFNVSTELKHVLIDTTRDWLAKHPDTYNPGKLDAAIRAAIADRVERYIDLLGSREMAA
jgi:tagatose 1,6-diphosphate aldolase GatY/KbaY